jgi:hypothetical protein
MAILKAEILSHLNDELNRTETDIDTHVLSAMKYLSLQDKFIWIESTVSVTAGTVYYSMPSDYRKLMTIHLTDEKPLEEITWRQYRNRIADMTDEDDRDEPSCFAMHGGFWYPYPIADDTYTATLHYNAYVPESEVIDEATVNAVDNIDNYYPDIFRDALNNLTKAYYCMSKGLKDEASNYLLVFRNIDLPPLKELVKREKKSLPYHDLW